MLKNALKSSRLLHRTHFSSLFPENRIVEKGIYAFDIIRNSRLKSKYSAESNQQENKTNDKDVLTHDVEHDDHHLNPVLKTMVPDNTKHVRMVDIVPGKGPPPEPPLDCCMSGCPSCLWINYAEELKEYYADGDDRALKAIEQIENQSLKMFIKLELGYL